MSSKSEIVARLKKVFAQNKLCIIVIKVPSERLFPSANDVLHSNANMKI